MIRRAAVNLWILAVLFAAAGASCPTLRPQTVPPSPVVFPQPPSIQEIVGAINANTDRVTQLHTDSASLLLPGTPALRASLALQRPRSIRLLAQFVGVGRVLDFGSNDERFWALVDAPQLATDIPRAVYFARHDQFRRGAAGQTVPIEPQWLIDAFGLVRCDPSGIHEGPYRRTQGQWEIRSRTFGPDGDLTRVIVLHETYGWILEQHLYDAQGRLLVSALASNHRHYPAVGVSLPHRVEIRLPGAGPSIRLDVQTFAINQLYGDPMQLWTMPDFTGYPLVDLSDPRMQPRLPGSGPVPAMPATTPQPGYPATGYRMRYRGYQ